MRPYDCKDEYDVKCLKEQGLSYNEMGITVIPIHVLLEIGSCQVKIPQRVFKRFAKWYLAYQDKDDEEKLKKLLAELERKREANNDWHNRMDP